MLNMKKNDFSHPHLHTCLIHICIHIYIYYCWKKSKLKSFVRNSSAPWWYWTGIQVVHRRVLTIIAIIPTCARWALFVVTLTNTVHLICIYIYIYTSSKVIFGDSETNSNETVSREIHRLWQANPWLTGRVCRISTSHMTLIAII